jgi:hypothetical protein
MQQYICFKCMLYNINTLYLHCVFHGIRFKVSNEVGVVGRQPFLFYTVFYPILPLFNRTFKIIVKYYYFCKYIIEIKRYSCGK